MVAPSDITTMFGNLFNNNVIGTIMKYTWYTLIAAIIIAFFVALYFLIQYKYKIVYPQLIWDSNSQSAKIWKYKKDMGRNIKVDGVKKIRLLWQHKNIEPFDADDLMPGNRINILRFNEDGTYVKMPNIVKDGVFRFEHLTAEEKTWAILELKETANSNMAADTVKKIMIYWLLGTALVVLMVLVATYLTLKYTSNVTQALEGVTPALKNIGMGLGGKFPS